MLLQRYLVLYYYKDRKALHMYIYKLICRGAISITSQFSRQESADHQNKQLSLLGNKTKLLDSRLSSFKSPLFTCYISCYAIIHL